MTVDVNLSKNPGLGAVGNALDGQKYETFFTSFDPDTQVWDTLPWIQRYVAEDSQSPIVQSLAQWYRNRMPMASIAEIAWQATKDHLVFASDQAIARRYAPSYSDDVVIEVLRRPVDVILFNHIQGRKAEGDCDDHSMFAATIATVLGAQVEFVCVAADPSEPSVLSHIYTLIDGFPCDASHGPIPGWEVPAIAVSRRVVFSARSCFAIPAILIGLSLWWWLR